MNNEFEMPTPCIVCGEIFELNEGYEGLTTETDGIIICESCHSKQKQELNKLLEIEDLFEKKDEFETDIQEAKETLKYAEGRIEEIEHDLKNLEFCGDLDILEEKLTKFS